MTERNVCLSILRLQPGMRLARAVMRPDGAVLMPAGAEIDESALKQLPQRGIEFVFVVEADTRDAETIARDVAAAEERVNFIFRGISAKTNQAISRDGAATEGDEFPGMGEMRDDLHAAVLAYRKAQAGR